MRIILMSLIFLSQATFAFEYYPRYRNQKASLIQWDRIDTDSWLSLREWKKQTDLKKNVTTWYLHTREAYHKEKIGHILAISGEVWVYRRDGYFRASRLTTLEEGDLVKTKNGAGAWIFLMDGSLIRLASHTQLGLNEIAVSNKEFYFRNKLIAGHVIYYPRFAHEYKNQMEVETDPLYYPLENSQANFYQDFAKLVDERNLIGEFKREDQTPVQITRLNRWINYNIDTLKTEKKTIFHLVTNFGTIEVDKTPIEAFVSKGDELNFRFIDFSELFVNPQIKSLANFTLFADVLEKHNNLQLNKWYLVEHTLERLQELDSQAAKRFAPVHKIAFRIPTLLIEREILLSQKSFYLFEEQKIKKFALNWGYRLWEQKDLLEHLKYVAEHDYRAEREVHRLVKNLIKEDEQLKNIPFSKTSKKHFQKAIDAYRIAIEND